MALQAGIGARGLWSVSRGLARGVESRGDYKRMMNHADMPRQGNLDGRGNLSRRVLTEFTAWFLTACLDQVTFMSSLFALEHLAERLKLYVSRCELKPEAFDLLEYVLQRGELARGEAARVTGLKERSAPDLLGSLLDRGILGSETPKAAVCLRFRSMRWRSCSPTCFLKRDGRKPALKLGLAVEPDGPANHDRDNQATTRATSRGAFSTRAS